MQTNHGSQNIWKINDCNFIKKLGMRQDFWICFTGGKLNQQQKNKGNEWQVDKDIATDF